MSEKHPDWYEEEKEMPQLLGWVVIVLFSAAIFGYGWVAYLFVDDGPRYWEYRILPDTPAESIYNTELPDKPAKAPLQVRPLPGAGRGGQAR